MSGRPPGNPGEIIACAAQLNRLSAQAESAASQVSATAKKPGYTGLGAVAYSVQTAGVALELRARATELAALARQAIAAAEKLRAEQTAWDRAEAARQQAARDRARRDGAGNSGPTDMQTHPERYL